MLARLPLGPLGRRSLLALFSQTRKVRRWHALAGSVAAAWLAARSARRVKAEGLEHRRERQRLARKVDEAESYAEWVTATSDLERHEGKHEEDEGARWAKETSLYDRELLKARFAHLLKIREKGDVAEMVYALRTDMLRNLGNMSNKDLYNGRTEVPKAVQDYISELPCSLSTSHHDFPDFNVEDKPSSSGRPGTLGRTALVLSGVPRHLHVGVVRALYEQTCRRGSGGSSVGAVICAIVCTRSDLELEN